MFHFEVTEDGSLSLRLGGGEDRSEAMHSLRGAFSETVYIYGTAIETSLRSDFPPQILSLGLGLGYVEVLAAGLILQRARELSPEAGARLLKEAGGESFELVPELREWFRSWVLGGSNVPDDFTRAYEDVLARTSSHVGLPPEEIRSFLREMIASDRWRIREALTAETQLRGGFGCVCFDAFSSKTSPELWTEEFLREFFLEACAEHCVLSTYACTGALKRSLRAAGFDLQIREGFSSKRDSTFAVRGPSQDETNPS